jgi:hypothetical protein
MNKQARDTKSSGERHSVVDSLNHSMLTVAAHLAEFATLLKRTETSISGRAKQRV